MKVFICPLAGKLTPWLNQRTVTSNNTRWLYSYIQALYINTTNAVVCNLLQLGEVKSGFALILSTLPLRLFFTLIMWLIFLSPLNVSK